MLIRLLQSTTLILFALLLCGDLAWRFNERKYSNQVDEAGLVKSIQKSVSTHTVSPDVLVVGTSLSYCFTYDVDSTQDVTSNKNGDPAGNHGNCAEDPFMASLLAKYGKQHKVVYVMALPGAMATDIANIIESSFAEGKHPKEVVYTACPRDFCDNLAVTSYGAKTFSVKAANSQAASNPEPVSPVQQMRDRLASMVPPAMSRRIDRLASNPSCGSVMELVLCSGSMIYEQRAHLHDLIVNALCGTFNRDKDVWSAAHNVRENEKKMTHFDHDLANYVSRYQPPNYDRYKKELPSLAKMASVCHEHGAKLVILNMPVALQNRKLVAPKLYNMYLKDLAEAEPKDSVMLINTDQWSDQFTREMFLDSAHLSRAGSKRLQMLIAPKLAEGLR